jgi:hypothetical protein
MTHRKKEREKNQHKQGNHSRNKIRVKQEQATLV